MSDWPSRAHQIAVARCTAVADEMGGTMSCTDEYECTAPDECGHYRQALLDAAEEQRQKDVWE